jgi:hypothetical protein
MPIFLPRLTGKTDFHRHGAFPRGKLTDPVQLNARSGFTSCHFPLDKSHRANRADKDYNL